MHMMNKQSTTLPPSRRGAANLEQNLMMDLGKEMAMYPAYHPTECPDGLIDISSSSNSVMKPQVQKWLDGKCANELAQIVKDCKSLVYSVPNLKEEHSE